MFSQGYDLMLSIFYVVKTSVTTNFALPKQKLIKHLFLL